MAFKVPDLPYSFDALEPVIDTQTMQIHHDKHHGTYVTNLNKALEGKPTLEGQSIAALMTEVAALPADIQTAVRNNGGGHANHSLFWPLLAPKGGGGSPNGSLGQAIERELGGLAKFKEDFGKAALGRFGSGWAWLVLLADGKLAITSTANQDNPLMGTLATSAPGTPIIGLDVWEHAYYLKYQNRRADYIAAWWDVLNWSYAQELYAQAIKQ